MGLIADIVESFSGAFSGFAKGFKNWGEDANADLHSLKASMDTFIRDYKVGETRDNLDNFGDILDGITGIDISPYTHPQRYIEDVFGQWDRILKRAMATLNVEQQSRDFEGSATSRFSLSVELANQSSEAQKRITAAIAAVNAVLLMGNAASIAAEALSAGVVRSISDAIQSWIWANGLGGLSSMAYSPQLGASVAPWLDRLYNRQAQAKLPGTGDLIRFQLREVWDQGRRQELLDASDRSIFEELMAQSGYDKYTSDSYWAAHWVLPSITQLNEMLFRGIIDSATWQQFVRYNDYDPSSIPRLEQIIYSSYTRVDARRMSKMGVLNDAELLQAYAAAGYYAPTERQPDGSMKAVEVANPDFTVHKAQALVVFTKVFNALPELRQRYRRGWISEGELLLALKETGIPNDRAQTLYETIVTADRPERIAPEKELSRALIARAWKLQIIGFNQALFLLQRLGWSRPEADLILRVQQLPDFPGAFTGSELGGRLTGRPVAPQEEVTLEDFF